MKNKHAAIEMSFGWLFAIIVGAVIIFLAIYFSTKIMGSADESTSAKVGKEINILLEPLETSFESSQTTSIKISSETRINNLCSEETPFGKQSLQIDQKRFNKWTKTDTDVVSYNKYIFSKEQVEGKTFYLFSKPFDFPFKIANLIYLTSLNDVYCFVNAPTEIKEEITNLNQENLIVDKCQEGNIRVCFDNSKCEINVNYNGGYLKKGNEIFYFDGIEDSNALMYAAIFSDREVYECQIKRLMMRLKELALIYSEKDNSLKEVGCRDDMEGSLIELGGLAELLKDSSELSGIKETATNIKEENEGRGCLLW